MVFVQEEVLMMGNKLTALQGGEYVYWWNRDLSSNGMMKI